MLITATVRTTITNIITSTVVVSAAQAGLVYALFTGPRAPTSGTYAICPVYGAADHQYQVGSMFIDPRGVGIYGYPDAGYVKIGAVGGVPVGAVGYLEPSGRPEQGSLGERTGAVLHCEQVTMGATELGQRRQGPPGTVGTRAYPQTLCAPTKP